MKRLTILCAKADKSAAAPTPEPPAAVEPPAVQPPGEKKERGPSAAVLALVSQGAAPGEGQLKRRTNAPLFLPENMPVGSFFVAEIVDVIKSPAKTVKAPLVHFKRETDANGQRPEFTFPCTGVLRDALLEDKEFSGKKDDESDVQYRDRLIGALQPNKGKWFVVKRLEDGISKTYGGKRMFLFDVWEYTPEKK